MQCYFLCYFEIFNTKNISDNDRQSKLSFRKVTAAEKLFAKLFSFKSFEVLYEQFFKIMVGKAERVNVTGCSSNSHIKMLNQQLMEF